MSPRTIYILKICIGVWGDPDLWDIHRLQLPKEQQRVIMTMRLLVCVQARPARERERCRQ
eukprot:1143263-Pelagomonas_calceolata.AAC.1